MLGNIGKKRILCIAVLGIMIPLANLGFHFITGFSSILQEPARGQLFFFSLFFLAVWPLVGWPTVIFLGFRTVNAGKVAQLVRHDRFLTTTILGLSYFGELIALLVLASTTAVFAVQVSLNITKYIFLREGIHFYFALFSLLFGPYTLVHHFDMLRRLFVYAPARIGWDWGWKEDEENFQKAMLSKRLEEVKNHLSLVSTCGFRLGIFYFEHALVVLKGILKDELKVDLPELTVALSMIESIKRMRLAKETQLLRQYADHLLRTINSGEITDIHIVLAKFAKEKDLQYARKFQPESQYALMKNYLKVIALSVVLPVVAAIFEVFPEDTTDIVLLYVTFFLIFLVFVIPIPFIYSRVSDVYRRMPSFEEFLHVTLFRKDVSHSDRIVR